MRMVELADCGAGSVQDEIVIRNDVLEYVPGWYCRTEEGGKCSM